MHQINSYFQHLNFNFWKKNNNIFFKNDFFLETLSQKVFLDFL